MCYFHRSGQWILSICNRCTDLFFQKSSSVWGMGLFPSSRASEESFLRTAWIWWLHSITADSKECMMPLSTTFPLLCCISKPFWNIQMGQLMCICELLYPGCLFTSCLSPGRLAPLYPILLGVAAKSCLGLGLIPQTHCFWGSGHGVWCPLTLLVAIQCGSCC